MTDITQMSSADAMDCMLTMQAGMQTCQEAARQMVKQNEHTPGRGGSIITMSSVNAVMAIPTCAGYNASKGGISNLTRCHISTLTSADTAGIHCMPGE